MRTASAPRVDGDTLMLRPLEHADVASWFAYLSLPAVLEHTSWSLAGEADLHRLVDDCESDGPDSAIRFAVLDAVDGRLAGTIGLPVISSVHRTAEVAYDFHPAYAGRGVATRCCRAVSSWALDTLGFVRVQATTLDSNVASRRVIEKSGFAFEGRLKNLKMVRGEPRDFDLFARTATR